MALNVNKDKTKELIGKYRNDFDKETEFILVIKMIKEMKLSDGFTIGEYPDDDLSKCLNEYSITGGLTLGLSYSDRGRLDHFLDQYKEPLSRKHLYAFHRIRDFLRANDLADESAILNIQIKVNDYKIGDLHCTDDNIGFGMVLCALQIPLSEATKLIDKKILEDVRHKKIEFDASIKLIKERNLCVCFSKIIYESEALNKVIRTHWHKGLLTNGTDQQRINSMIRLIDSTNNNIKPKKISDAEMYALYRFKILLVSNGYTEASVLLDVEYTSDHLRYLCERITEDDIDHIVPFQVLHYVSEKVGNNFYYAANFAVHFDQSYNTQRLSINDNRGVKTTQINEFLKDNTNRGKFVVQMIEEYQNTIRNKVQESMEKVEYRNKIDYKACINELDKLLDYKKDEVSELGDGMAAINIQQMAHPAHEDASAILNIPLDVNDDNIGLWLTLCALNIPLDRAKDLVIEYKGDRKHDKEIEFLASIKMIKERKKTVQLSKELLQSINVSYDFRKLKESLQNIQLENDMFNEGNINIIITKNNIKPDISDAEMYALFRFKRFFIKNGLKDASAILDVKYTSDHLRYICQRLHEDDFDYIVPFKVLHYVSENLGYNYAVHFAVHFERSYNKQYLSDDDRLVKRYEINEFLEDNTKRGYFVLKMIERYQNNIRDKVQEWINKDEYREYRETNQACLHELNILL